MYFNLSIHAKTNVFTGKETKDKEREKEKGEGESEDQMQAY